MPKPKRYPEQAPARRWPNALLDRGDSRRGRIVLVPGTGIEPALPYGHGILGPISRPEVPTDSHDSPVFSACPQGWGLVVLGPDRYGHPPQPLTRVKCGPAGGRTQKPFQAADFKSAVFASFTTGPRTSVYPEGHHDDRPLGSQADVSVRRRLGAFRIFFCRRSVTRPS